MNSTRWGSSIVLCTFWVLAACSENAHQAFSKAFFYTFSHDGPSIILGFVSHDGSHLSGTFTFENISGEREQAKDVAIRGVRRPGGFWASVRCEARRDENSAWEPLGTSWVVGWPAHLTVKAESKPVEFSVRLDVFEGLGGKYHSGRIVLSSGDTSQFLLEDLTPRDGHQSSNQAMQRTASQASSAVLRHCHPRFGCVACCSGLAVADLVSR